MLYILLGRGFEELEAVTTMDILRRGSVAACFVSLGSAAQVEGAHGITLTAEVMADSIVPSSGDVFVIPGGMGGVNSIKSSQTAMELLKSAEVLGCCLAAICAGPAVLAELGILKNKTITCYPGCEDMMGGAKCKTSLSTYADGSLITGRAPGSATDFALALLAHLKGGETAEAVRRALVY